MELVSELSFPLTCLPRLSFYYFYSVEYTPLTIKMERERDSHTINCVHENQKQLGGNINRHAQPSTQEWPLQTSRLTSSFAPISNAASMRGRKKSPSQNQPSNNNRRTPIEGDTI